MNVRRAIAAGLAVTALSAGVIGCGTESSSADGSDATPNTVTLTEDDVLEALEDVQPESSEPDETVSQQNARQKAEDYLDYSAFSRKKLIEQLEYEGFSKADATYAVGAVSPNWNEQAAKKAKDYLDYSSFSRSRLIEQLEYEGFTTKQATYGVNQTGL